MALSPLRAGRERRTAAAFLVAGVFALSAVVAHAEDGNSVGVAGASSPVEQFSRQLEDFQKSVPDLNKSIQESTGAIDSVTDIDKARADIDKLREQVSTLLGAVSDNGPVSQLGIKALDHIRAKLKTLSQEQRFRPEERQFLSINGNVCRVRPRMPRAQFASLLQVLQSNEDFIDELVEVRQAEKALDVIRRLTQNIRDAANQLNKLIGSIKPPGA
jgi:chromosome segregation ATPase